jgi:hypothetical protein
MRRHVMMVLEAFAMVVVQMLQVVSMEKFHDHYYRYCYQLNKHKNLQ